MKFVTLFVAVLALGVSVLAFLRASPPAFASVLATSTARGGVYATCDRSGDTIRISAQFNNVNTNKITIRSGDTIRGCIIHFPFKVRNHVALASYAGVDPAWIAVNNGMSLGMSTNDIAVSIYAPSQNEGGGSFYLVVY